MAGIKEPIHDILVKLREIPVTLQAGVETTMFTRIWNSQLDAMENGDGYAFQMPACFVEVLSNPTYEQLGIGFRMADLGVRIHLVHEFRNDVNGEMEQDLEIFDVS